jgi:hypothetical protein
VAAQPKDIRHTLLDKVFDNDLCTIIVPHDSFSFPSV